MVAKRRKNSTEGKITIYPYANNKLKGVVYEDADDASLTTTKYPLYIRVIAKQQTTSFVSVSFLASLFDIPTVLYDVEDIEEQIDQNPTIREIVNEEIEVVLQIIKDLKPFEDDSFNIKNVVKRVNRCYETVFIVIKQHLERKMWDVFSSYATENPTVVPTIEATKHSTGFLQISVSQKTLDNSWVLSPELRKSREWIDAKNYVWALSDVMPGMKQLKEKYSLALWCYDDILAHMFSHYKKHPKKKRQYFVKDWESGKMQENLRTIFAHDKDTIEVFLREVDQIIREF